MKVSATGVGVLINQANGDATTVVDFLRSDVSVVTGPSRSLKMTLDGTRGELVRASGTLTLDVYGFFQVTGDLAIEKSNKTITLAKVGTAAAEQVEAGMLTIGGSGINAFAGINGNSPDRLGLALTNVEFGLALLTSKAQPTRKWTALQATAGSVAFVGLGDSVKIGATNVGVLVNQADGAATDVVDFTATDLTVATGTTKGLKLSLDGSRGEMIRASGQLNLDLFGFFQVSGELAVEKSSKSVTLTKVGNAAAETVAVDLLTVGGSGLNAFAGIGGNTSSRFGLALTGVEFGLALMTSKASNTRKWTALQASAGSVAFVGLGDSVKIQATNVGVLINQADGNATDVVDFSATDLSVAVGTGKELKLSIDKGLGEVIRAAGTLTLDIFGFFQVSGNLAVEKRSQTVTLAKKSGSTTAERVDVDLLSIGGSNLTAFAGIKGGTADELGLKLENVAFGLALMTGKADASRKWTSLEASASRAGFVGIGGLTISANNLVVNINQADKENDQVVDFSTGATVLAVPTGVSSTLNLSIDGAKGELIRVDAGIVIDLFGFFRVSGNFSIESATTKVALSRKSGQTTSEVIDVDTLTIGGSNVNAFAGVNGGTDDAIGLALEGVNFGIGFYTDKKDASRKWTALKASATRFGFVGIGDFLPSLRNLSVDINQATREGDQVIDFATRPVAIPTGPSSTITVNHNGAVGELIRVEADLTLNLFNFAYFSGRLGFEKYTPAAPLKLRSKSGTLSDVEATSMMAITGQNIQAFVGYADGGIDSSRTLSQQADRLYGFGVEGVDFGVVLVKAGGQSYTTVDVAMDRMSIFGIDQSVFELSLEGIRFKYNSQDSSNKSLDYAASFNGALLLGSTGAIKIDSTGYQLGVYVQKATLAIS
ncbi:MAG: hypothetical protein EBT33_09415, partial [Betaproteobacteria bacterium]|nr:hypothetical protein [Betaproteobacteria bacterium]